MPIAENKLVRLAAIGQNLSRGFSATEREQKFLIDFCGQLADQVADLEAKLPARPKRLGRPRKSDAAKHEAAQAREAQEAHEAAPAEPVGNVIEKAMAAGPGLTVS